MPLCVSTSQHHCLVVIHAILNNLHQRIAKHGTPVINHPSGSIRAYVKTNTFALVWRCVKLISGVCLWLTWHATPAKPALSTPCIWRRKALNQGHPAFVTVGISKPSKIVVSTATIKFWAECLGSTVFCQRTWLFVRAPRPTLVWPH